MRRTASRRQTLQWQCGDTAALLGAAHTLKGAAASIGATGLRTCCLALERAARAGAGDLGALLAPLGEEFERVGSDIKRLLQLGMIEGC